VCVLDRENLVMISCQKAVADGGPFTFFVSEL
jgi:hypothetical protein